MKTDKIMAQFQCRCLRQDRWLRVKKNPVDIPQNYVVGQQRQQILEIQIDEFPNHPSFLVLKTRLKTQVSCGSDFLAEAMLWIKEVERVDSLDELKSSGSVNGKDFPKLWDAGREDCLGSEQDHPEFPVQKEGQPRGAESPKRGPVSERETNRLHDLRLFSSDWCSWRSNGLCWFLLCCSPWWQHSGIRNKMGRSSTMSKNPSDDIWKVWRKRESDQLKTVLELYVVKNQRVKLREQRSPGDCS